VQSSANNGVIPVVVLPESQSVQALRPLISIQVARHLLSSSEHFGRILVFWDGISLCFRVLIVFDISFPFNGNTTVAVI
jgi:hypothetical protein